MEAPQRDFTIYSDSFFLLVFAVGQHRQIMKLKKLRKKVQRLEIRLQERAAELAKFKRQLEQAEAAKASKAARKSATGATEGHSDAKRTETKKAGIKKKPKRKLNLSPERRAQLSASMRARWAARRAGTDTNATRDSSTENSADEPRSRPPENGSDSA